MAKATLVLDTRKNSRSKVTGLYPIVISIHHHRPRMIRTGSFTSESGWDKRNNRLRKSVMCNKNLNCDQVNMQLSEKLYLAKKVIHDMGMGIENIDVDRLVKYIRDAWDGVLDDNIKIIVENRLSLQEWGEVLIERKCTSNEPGTAGWLQNAIRAITKFNNGEDILLHEITPTFLKEFETHHLAKGNSKNTIGIYIRALRSMYNSAIGEERFQPIKNPFKYYRVPSAARTRKRAISKRDILQIKSLVYPQNTILWHAQNYAMVMFYCRGMNFVDLVQIRAKDVFNGRLSYGRSKTDEPLSVKITEDLNSILDHYLDGKNPGDYLFPTNYDGSTRHFQMYKSQRRRMNERLRIIAKDAGIDSELTTYTIRHSWATIAKYIGISTALISEGLGHSTIKTTEVYLKDFDNSALDEMNELVTSFD